MDCSRVKAKFLIFGLLVCLLFVSGCSGVRWQMKETVVYVFEIEELSSSNQHLPLAGAQVSISGEGYSATKFTDSEGKAVFQVPPGTYTLQASKAGYRSASEIITLYTLELTTGYYYLNLIPGG
ncbi:MAG: Carboxypeptidase regulatory-like domain [Candidatus Atribacteria bacterium]|nr:Carboxypeptidase regulatory-like domain [Candidatus Atribacteria bacterium]